MRFKVSEIPFKDKELDNFMLKVCFLIKIFLIKCVLLNKECISIKYF